MLYKRESWMDKVLRMRGLSILVTAPLVIAALYILLFPRLVSIPTSYNYSVVLSCMLSVAIYTMAVQGRAYKLGQHQAWVCW